MKIINTSLNSNIGFDCYVDFEVPQQDEPNEDAASHAVAEWVSNAFKENFVILQHATKIFAGGAVDNAQSWAGQWNSDSTYHPTGVYQLRCSEGDVTLFLLKYQKANT